jgi:hypothetical protein
VQSVQRAHDRRGGQSLILIFDKKSLWNELKIQKFDKNSLYLATIRTCKKVPILKTYRNSKSEDNSCLSIIN